MLISGVERILIIAPHADDEVIGCGGLIEKGCRYSNEVKVVVVAVGNIQHQHKDKVISGEIRKNELKQAMDFLGCNDIEIIYDDKDSLLDTIPRREIISEIEKIIYDYAPTIVFIPLPSYHQDHVITFESCIAALRPNFKQKIKLIAMYEYPLTSWQFQQFWSTGELYLDISSTIQKKMEAFRKHKSQIRPPTHPISPESIQKWAAMRGLEVGLDYAEKYYILRSQIL